MAENNKNTFKDLENLREAAGLEKKQVSASQERLNIVREIAKEAKEKGNREKYEQIRGDIFREFDFDIGKFAKGGGVAVKGLKFRGVR